MIKFGPDGKRKQMLLTTAMGRIITSPVSTINYLFNTDYAQKSIERNTHYFGDHTSHDHYEAFQERKQINAKTLN